MKNKTTLSLFVVVVLLFNFANESLAGEKKEKSSGMPFKIALTPMGGEYPSSVTNNDNQHPYDIPEEAFFRMLNNLSYKNKKKVMNGYEEKSNPVFSEKVARVAAKYLRDAFLKINPGQKVAFTNHTSKGDTICDIFVQKEIINWKFFSVQGQPKNKAMWMLAKGYLQDYYGTGNKFLSVQGILGGGNYLDLTWIQIPLIQLITEVKSEGQILSKKTEGGASTDGKDKLEKLKKLAAMYHRKLISEDEFKAKAGELMQKSAGEKMEMESELEYLKILKDEKVITRDAYMQKRNIILEKF